jgi:ABC-type cobalamin/Fe3+-siderophores transport system ATPase subunit
LVLTPDIIQDIYGMRTHILPHPDTQRPLVVIDRQTNETNAK